MNLRRLHIPQNTRSSKTSTTILARRKIPPLSRARTTCHRPLLRRKTQVRAGSHSPASSNNRHTRQCPLLSHKYILYISDFPSMHRVLIPFPASPYRFDPAFAFPAQMRYPPPLFPDEQVDLDEHGQVNWASMWKKELTNLMTFTEQQEKAGADPEWFRNMLTRVRTAMMAPPMNPGEPIAQPTIPAAPNPGEAA